MAKPLTLVLQGKSYALAPTKIERKKLYGWTELRVTDADGIICRQAGLDSNGVTVIPKGATKIGMLRSDGIWMEKDELQAVYPDGRVAEAVASSFDADILLDHKVSVEALFDNVISSVYQLAGDDMAGLVAALGNDIFRFPFSYRGGYESANGFLLSNGSVPFIFVGTEAIFDYIGLDEQAVIDEPADETETEEDDLDFSMF